MSDKGIREEVPPVLQYQILQLALDLPASKFSWFRIQVKFLDCCAYFKPIFLNYCLFLVNNKYNFKHVVCCSQGVADSESSGEKSVLYLLLKMFVSSSSNHLKTSTRSLILKVRFFLFSFILCFSSTSANTKCSNF